MLTVGTKRYQRDWQFHHHSSRKVSREAHTVLQASGLQKGRQHLTQPSPCCLVQLSHLREDTELIIHQHHLRSQLLQQPN